MRRIRIRSVALCLALIAAAPSTTAVAQTVPPTPEFTQWLVAFKQEAVRRGIRAETVEKAMEGVRLIERVIELDRRQPEFTQTFWGYLLRVVSPERIARGRELLARHGAILKRIQSKFGVQPRFLVAFWGMETNYGQYTGKMPVVGSLVTLAYDRRRSRFFREQLIAALQIMDRGDIPLDAVGSWAGAMGQAQFIPTTYRDNAVDGDGDGKSDMWNSLPDVFASASNYLSRAGWQPGRTWGREVQLPKGFDLSLSGLGTKKKLADWQAIGVRRMGGRDLPKVDIQASLLLPNGHKGPAFLVYKNFRTILVWNRSILYAMAVGHLADRLVGGGPFLTPVPPNERPLARDEVIEIQQLLALGGYYDGPVDGIAGSGTRRAARAFQQATSRPADGHLDTDLLAALRSVAKRQP